MSDSAKRLLDLLQQRKLLATPLVDSLRKQISQAKDEVTAQQLARLLERKGKLTEFQANDLLKELEATAAAAQPAPAKEAPATPSAFDELPDAAPLDDVLSDPLAQEGAANPLMMPKKKGWFGGSSPHRKRKSLGWESPLFIVGGGVLLLLLIVGVTLLFVLSRGSGDDMFEAAEQDYLAGAYGQAIAKYDKFLARQSGHPKTSFARVHRHLAEVRDATSGEAWGRGLVAAQQALPKIEQEEAFDAARPEVAGLLADITAGLAAAAAASGDDASAAAAVEQFQTAMILVENPVYVPGSQRAALKGRFDRSQEQIDVVVRDLQRNSRLEEAIEKMRAASESEKPMQAYPIYEELVQAYPRLEDNVALKDALQATAARLAAHVKLLSLDIKPVKQERPSAVVAETALAKPSGQAIAGLEGAVVPMTVDGVLYVLSAADGRLLWRRHVGRASPQ
ncbi:MAG: hypothetical protein KDA41_22535, partial [Planctomycetales bacterium]|nr:hypothetical protein [Planctomycetales bacterium]